MNSNASLAAATAPARGPRQHSHVFDEGNPLGERSARLAVILTAAMMVLEIASGYYFNSMALLADGWHMSSHALALGLSLAAFVAARRLSRDTRFAFGTWKIEVLAGYTSAIFLLLVAGLMAYQSVERLWVPVAIHYEQAIGVAVIGLVVNLVCAWLLKDGHQHHHHHPHGHAHDGPGHATHGDLNLRSAYLHVLADAATSVMAIVALLGGLWWGAGWLDPVMGLVGSVLVAVWAFGLLRDSSRVLLDAEMNAPVVDEVREAIAEGPHAASISDLHVWRVGKAKYACIVAVEAHGHVDADYVRQLLSVHEELAHVTVEVNRLRSAA
jgi:cation diffusion facilitator family transporter